MPLLTDPDFKALIKLDVLDKLIEGDNTIKASAESMAIGQMRSHIGVRYNASQAFSNWAVTKADAPEVLMYLVDITLYHIYTRQAPGQVPKLREERYADAIKWLEKVAGGTYALPLPAAGDADGDGIDDLNEVKWGGEKPRKPYY